MESKSYFFKMTCIWQQVSYFPLFLAAFLLFSRYFLKGKLEKFNGANAYIKVCSSKCFIPERLCAGIGLLLKILLLQGFLMLKTWLLEAFL